MLRKILTHFKSGTVELNYGREILTSQSLKYLSHKKTIQILDIGMGSGNDLLNIRNTFKKFNANVRIELFGIDSYEPNLINSKKKNINCKLADIERDIFPFKSESFDLVIANQVIEHTKDIFWIYSEISRVLKKDGIVITGVPNLASLHNRIALLFGVQPTCSEILGPHVRSITAPSFINFIEADGYFKNLEVKGSNFYPFPKNIAIFLSRLFPTLSVSIFFITQRTKKPGLFKDTLENRFFETNYYTGKNISSQVNDINL